MGNTVKRRSTVGRDELFGDGMDGSPGSGCEDIPYNTVSSKQRCEFETTL
jgi:hypothetical protein